MVYVKKKTFSDKVEKLKDQARALYFSGMTTREVGVVVKRSHNWVAESVRESGEKKLSTD